MSAFSLSKAKNVGLSIIELLVIMVVIIVLFAIIFPIFSGSKRKAHVADDINNLRQLGLASSLYYSSNDSNYPLAPKFLVTSGLISPRRLESILDPTESGWFNSYLEYEAKFNPKIMNRKYDYRISYFGIGDMFKASLDKEQFLQRDGNPGWLVSVSPAEKQYIGQPFKMLLGVHFRLTFDGGVLRRNTITHSNGKSDYIKLFRDYTSEELKELD